MRQKHELNPDFVELSNGCRLYWEENEVGGRRFTSDEVGGGVVVWDTSIISMETMMTALLQEQRLTNIERRKQRSLPKGAAHASSPKK